MATLSNPQLDERLNKSTTLQMLSEKTGMSKTNIFFVLVGLFGAFVFFGFGARPLSQVIGVIYPTYASFKAVRSSGKDDDSFWLTYWVVYGFTTVVEIFADFLLFWIPMYYLVKIIFLVFLMHPSTKGAEMVYNKAIKPLISMYEEDVDKGLEKVKSATSKRF